MDSVQPNRIAPSGFTWDAVTGKLVIQDKAFIRPNSTLEVRCREDGEWEAIYPSYCFPWFDTPQVLEGFYVSIDGEEIENGNIQTAITYFKDDDIPVFPKREDLFDKLILSKLPKLNHPEVFPSSPPKSFPGFVSLYELIDKLPLTPQVEGRVPEVEVLPQRLPETPEIYLRDMPDSVLDGRLGEICQRRMSHFPIAYSWPALLAVASALIGERAPGVHTNLYSCLVGPVHSGKSQAIDFAVKTLGLEPPALMEMMAGSAEALVREMSNAAGNPRLFSPDELGHTLEKMQIERSSFSFMFNTAFYKTKFRVLMGRKDSADVDCVLSILGGVVEDRFQDFFGAATVGGFYDRFAFGLCPGNFCFDFRPFEGPPELPPCPVSVRHHPEIEEMTKQWRKENPEGNPRVFEIALRAATVCASFDGKQVLTANDLKPHLELARYQHRIRHLVKPNSGETPEGQIAHKILDNVKSAEGKNVDKRELLHRIHAYDKGPSVADRALAVLIANGEIIETKIGRKRFLRWISDQEYQSND